MKDRSFELFGVLPQLIYRPESIAETQEVVLSRAGKSIVPWGGGTRQHVGYAPEGYDAALSLERLTQITDYQPADMTVTAQAGITVTQLQIVLGEHGQFLPVDIAEPDKQTIGGIIATRADSLRRFGFGSVRDSLIGVSVINAKSELVKGGGKVVKNVAGYDLPKMYCGSYGTLGVIVEASFKVSPLPETSATVVLPLDSGRNSEDVLDRLLASDLSPSFLFLLSPEAAKAMLSIPDSVPPEQYLVLGFDGGAEAVQWQLDTLGSPVLKPETSVGIRNWLRDFSHQAYPMTCAFHILSSQVGAFLRMVEWTANRAGFSTQVIADAGIGIMRAHFAPDKESADWMSFLKDLTDKAIRCGGSFIIERMPAELRELETPVWLPVLPDFELMQRLKKTLDPNRMWNPGRFLGRI